MHYSDDDYDELTALLPTSRKIYLSDHSYAEAPLTVAIDTYCSGLDNHSNSCCVETFVMHDCSCPILYAARFQAAHLVNFVDYLRESSLIIDRDVNLQQIWKQALSTKLDRTNDKIDALYRNLARLDFERTARLMVGFVPSDYRAAVRKPKFQTIFGLFNNRPAIELVPNTPVEFEHKPRIPGYDRYSRIPYQYGLCSRCVRYQFYNIKSDKLVACKPTCPYCDRPWTYSNLRSSGDVPFCRELGAVLTYMQYILMDLIADVAIIPEFGGVKSLFYFPCTSQTGLEIYRSSRDTDSKAPGDWKLRKTTYFTEVPAGSLPPEVNVLALSLVVSSFLFLWCSFCILSLLIFYDARLQHKNYSSSRQAWATV